MTSNAKLHWHHAGWAVADTPFLVVKRNGSWIVCEDHLHSFDMGALVRWLRDHDLLRDDWQRATFPTRAQAANTVAALHVVDPVITRRHAPLTCVQAGVYRTADARFEVLRTSEADRAAGTWSVFDDGVRLTTCATVRQAAEFIFGRQYGRR